jgi:uncharacterized membrane protein
MGFGGLILQPLAGVALMVVLGTRAAPLLIGRIILSYVLFRIKNMVMLGRTNIYHVIIDNMIRNILIRTMSLDKSIQDSDLKN